MDSGEIAYLAAQVAQLEAEVEGYEQAVRDFASEQWRYLNREIAHLEQIDELTTELAGKDNRIDQLETHIAMLESRL